MAVFYIGVAAFTPVPPIAYAGPDQSFNLPTTTATLTGSGTSTDGTIVSYAWTKLSGPSCSITSASSASTGITAMSTAGTYVFQLLVTDNYTLTGTDTISIIVADLEDIDIVGTMAAGSDNFTIQFASNIAASVDIVCTFSSTYTDISGSHVGPSGTLTILAGTTFISGGFGTNPHTSGMGGYTLTSLSTAPTTADSRTINIS